MKTVRLFVTNDEFESLLQGRKKWVQCGRKKQVGVGDLLVIMPFCGSSTLCHVEMVVMQVTEVSPLEEHFFGDNVFEWDIVSVSLTFESRLGS